MDWKDDRAKLSTENGRILNVSLSGRSLLAVICISQRQLFEFHRGT